MTAGYSDTRLMKKLGIRSQSRIALIDVPPDYAKTLCPLPEDVKICAVDSNWSPLKLVYRKKDR